jgi:hypothetical protein
VTYTKWRGSAAPSFNHSYQKMQNPFRSQETSQLEQMCGGISLTRTQRLMAFGILFATGFLLSFFSTFLLITLKLTPFAVIYSLGNVISLTATGFLVGFKKQLTKMFDSSRRLATGIFLGTLALTLLSAFVLKNALVTVIFCIIQYFALMWYSLSYVPFARDAIKRMFSKIF